MRPVRISILRPLLILSALACILRQAIAEEPPHANALTTGNSHVGKPLPEYLTGDECLFCHRNTVGSTWNINEHQRTLRPTAAVPEIEAGLRSHPNLQSFADQVRFILGNERQIRLLKKSEKYGHMDILSAVLQPNQDDGAVALVNKPPFHWDTETFGQRCAGCHATAVDSRTQAFSATGIDCYACHGVVDLKHAKDTSLVFLSKKRNDSPSIIASTCGQCHIRTGKSQASGLPYANNHVVGDNLFADFEVDLSPEALAAIPPRERHILANIRDSLHSQKQPERNGESITCLSCHSVHRASVKKHRKIAPSDYCHICHQPPDMELTYNRKEKHHPLCGY